MKIKDINKEDLVIQPIENADTIPASWYTSKEIYDFEISHLINSEWQYVGNFSQIPSIGDYFLFEISGKPILVVRSDDKTIKAFYNVCRHRGGPLALENGSCKLFQCKYHGWTYKLDGSLHKTPQFGPVENFNKDEFGLVPVNLDIWENLIFTMINNPSVNIQKIMSGVKDRIQPINLSDKKFYKRVHYSVNCNWKVYVDNYLEGYHLNFVHPSLSKLLIPSEYKTEVSEFYSLQYSPLKDDANFYGEGNAYYYFIFPNIMLNILPGRLQVNLVQPISIDKTIVIFDYFYDDIHSTLNVKKIEEDIKLSDEIQLEDIMICEKVQKGLLSGAYNKGRISPQSELGVYHFQSHLKRKFKTHIE
ncbi:MAG: aromatic ring-hydroxylating dioxygenase subunit alpha [Ignavibacteriales bacterium]